MIGVRCLEWEINFTRPTKFRALLPPELVLRDCGQSLRGGGLFYLSNFILLLLPLPSPLLIIRLPNLSFSRRQSHLLVWQQLLCSLLPTLLSDFFVLSNFCLHTQVVESQTTKHLLIPSTLNLQNEGNWIYLCCSCERCTSRWLCCSSVECCLHNRSHCYQGQALLLQDKWD